MGWYCFHSRSLSRARSLSFFIRQCEWNLYCLRKKPLKMLWFIVYVDGTLQWGAEWYSGLRRMPVVIFHSLSEDARRINWFAEQVLHRYRRKEKKRARGILSMEKWQRQQCVDKVSSFTWFWMGISQLENVDCNVVWKTTQGMAHCGREKMDFPANLDNVISSRHTNTPDHTHVPCSIRSHMGAN